MATTRKKRITLNVSGQIFETWESTLSRFPGTLLGREEVRKSYYCTTSGQYFFDRHRICFESILYFYQSFGSLKCPPEIPISIFEMECRYFGLPEAVIIKMKRREGIVYDGKCDVTKVMTSPLRMQIWNIIENPETSQFALLFGVFSISVTLLSIITACIDTVPGLHDNSARIFHVDYWFVIELVLHAWFLVELLLRWLFSINRHAFLHGATNIIDIMSLVPYFVLLALDAESTRMQGIFKTLRFIRVARLCRLANHSTRLQVVSKVLQASLHNIQLLLMFLFIAVCIGGTFIYYIEGDVRKDDFSSIPASLWWAVVTITSIGYGDMIPITIMGKLFASCFMIFGAITVALPVLTIVYLYPRNLQCETYVKGYDHDKTKRGSLMA